jgi:hypothetical protein
MTEDAILMPMPDKIRCWRCFEFKAAEQYLYPEEVHVCGDCLTTYGVGYIAGFFDGEGHVALRHSPSINFSQSITPPLHFIMERFPRGHLYFEGNEHLGEYKLVFNGTLALCILRVMLPHLIVKRAEAEEYIEIVSRKRQQLQTRDYYDEDDFTPKGRREPIIGWPLTPRESD